MKALKSLLRKPIAMEILALILTVLLMTAFIFLYIFIQINIWFLIAMLLLGLAIMAFVGTAIIKRILAKNSAIKKSIRELISQISSLQTLAGKVNESNEPMEELSNLKKSVNELIERFTHLPVVPRVETMPTEVARRIENGEFLTRGEFNQAVFFLSLTNVSYRSAYLLIKLVNAEPAIFFNNLKTEVGKSFKGAVLGVFADETLCVFLPKINSLSLLRAKMKNFYVNFSAARIEKRRNEITIAQIKIGATVFPYSTRRTFEKDALFALNKTKDFSIYLPKNRPPTISRNETAESLNRQFLLNAETLLSETKNTSDFVSLEKYLDRNLLKLATQFGFHNAGYLILDHSLEEYSVRFEESRMHENITFRKLLTMTYADLKPIFNLTDENGSLYGIEGDSYPVELNNLLSNLGVKSFYFQSIRDRDNNLGLLYFCSSEAGRSLTVNEQTIMAFVGAFIGTYIKETFQLERENRTHNLLEQVLKMDEQYVYIIDKKTYSLLYISDNLSQYYYSPKTIGEKCHKVFFHQDNVCEKCPLICRSKEISLPDISPLLLNRSVLNYSGNIDEATIAITSIKNLIADTEPHYLDHELSIKNKLRFELDLHNAVTEGRFGYLFSISPVNVTTTQKLGADEATLAILEKVFKAFGEAGFGNISYRIDVGTLVIALPNAIRMAALNIVEDLFRRVLSIFGSQETIPHFWMTLAQYPRDIKNIYDFDAFLTIGRKADIKSGEDMVYLADTKKARKAERRKYILDVFREAVEKNKLEHFIQPIINLSDGRTIGGEIFLRLYDNNRGYIPPFEFLPLASEENLMLEIENSLLFSVGELWKKYGFELFRAVGLARLAINISRDSLINPRFLEAIKQVISRYKLPKRFIQLEISENLLADNQNEVEKFMKSLTGLDVTVALDNFTNRSVDFEVVASLGFSCIKIDGDLVRSIVNDSETFLNFVHLISRINEKNIPFIVQGIETDSQADILRNIAVKQVQGFFFAKPMAVNDFIKYLDSGK